MLDKIQFENGTLVTKEWLNEVQRGGDFSGDVRSDYYSVPADGEHAGWQIGQRDAIKDWEIADPVAEPETNIGRLAHDGIVLGSYDPTTEEKVFGPPTLLETSAGSGRYGVWVNAGSIISTSGEPISWATQFREIVSENDTNYIYIDEESALANIAAGDSVTVNIGSSLPSVSQPHIPLAKIKVNADGTALLTDGNGYVDLRPSVYIGNLNTYPKVLNNTDFISTNYSAESWTRVIADTSNGSFIITLPATPDDSDRIAIVDISGTFDRFPIVLRPADGTKINSSVDDWIVNIRDSHLELFYHEATSEWKFEETPGGECTPVLGTFLSCGGKEFIGERLPEECPDGLPVPATYPDTPDSVYSYEASTSKCYRVINENVAVFANGQGSIIRVPNTPRCNRQFNSGGVDASNTRNIIYVDPAIGDDALSNTGFEDGRPFRSLERALIEAVRESRRAGQYNDRYDRVVIELSPGDYYVDNSPGSTGITSLTSQEGLIQRVDTSFDIINVSVADRATEIIIDSLDSISPFPPTSLKLGRIVYSQSGGVGNIVKAEKESLNSSIWKFTLEYVRGEFNTGDRLYYDNLSVINPRKGGLVVPRGISINGVDLRKVRIRPMYVPELEPVQDKAQTEKTSIFKLTGGSYISLITFTDNLQFSRSHNTVTAITFASEAELFGDGSETSYYQKVNGLFSDFDGWEGDGLEAIKSETTIVAPLAPSKDLRSQDLEENTTGIPLPDNRLESGISYPGRAKISTSIGGSTRNFDLPDINSTRSSSPYVFNCSVRSIFGLNGLWADGSLVGGFKSMVTANYTQVSLQTDPNCFNEGGYYLDPPTNKESGVGKTYRTSAADIFKYRHFGFRGSNDSTIQLVSCFVIGNADHFISESGADLSITNSCSDFGDISLRGSGYKTEPFSQDEGRAVAGYSGTRLSQIIPPLPLSYADGTLVDTQVNTSLVIDYAQTLEQALATKIGTQLANPIRVYIDNADAANPFSENNAPSASAIAFNQFSYTKKTQSGDYVHAGGETAQNRRQIYLTGFDEVGNSILYTGEIKLANDTDPGWDVLDDRSKVFVWDEVRKAWYFRIDTSTVVEEINDDNNDGYLTKKLDYAFRFKLNPGVGGTPLIYEELDFIFERSGVRIIRAQDTRTNDQRVYRAIFSGYNKGQNPSIRRPQSYYVLEKQITEAGYPLNASTTLRDDPLVVTQVQTLEEIENPNINLSTFDPTSSTFSGEYVTYLVNASNARSVFTGDLFPIVDQDHPELTEDPANSITKVALEYLQERPGVYLDKDILPNKERIDIKLRSNSVDTGILINLRRPSIIRASGHTWEWTGYLNYDTSFPSFQGEPLDADLALGKIIVEENGGRVYATGMNEEGGFYIGTNVFDLRSGEQYSIPLKAEGSLGNVTNQILNNVIIKNSLTMQDSSRIFLQKDTQIILDKSTLITSNTGPISPSVNAADNHKSLATTNYAGLVQIAKPEEIKGARNPEGTNTGISKNVVVTAYDLATEFKERLEVLFSAGTGVTVNQVDLPGEDGQSGTSDDLKQNVISIGQAVNTDSDVTFAKVTATTDICLSSDLRLKDNVIKIDHSLSKVEQLRGVSYELKSEPGKTRLGLIAQEVKEVFPEVVNLDDDTALYSVSYQSLVPVLIEAIKELSDRVKKLEDK
jgi:hypothetical protein